MPSPMCSKNGLGVTSTLSTLICYKERYGSGNHYRTNNHNHQSYTFFCAEVRLGFHYPLRYYKTGSYWAILNKTTLVSFLCNNGLLFSLGVLSSFLVFHSLGACSSDFFTLNSPGYRILARIRCYLLSLFGVFWLSFLFLLTVFTLHL